MNRDEKTVNQPGPLSVGMEYPAELAWEAFYAACWDAYDLVVKRRAAKATSPSITPAAAMPGVQDQS